MEATYSAYDVCRLVGITYRQLDYWTRLGKIEPSIPARGSGTQRRFTVEDVEKIRRLVRAREVLRKLRGGEGRCPGIADAAALAEYPNLERAEEVLEAVGL